MKRATPGPFKQSAWIAVLVVFAWALIGRDTSAKSLEGNSEPVISVWIYDYARISQSELDKTEGQAAALFAEAGVRIVWRDHLQKHLPVQFQPGNDSGNFFIRILPASMARQWNYKPRSLGESVISPTAEGPLPGGIANVFYDRVEHISYMWDLDPGEILGDAIAHELGHLLLGADHSGQGIMKARWSAQDLELAKRGNLRFLPIEITAIQRAARSLPRNFSTMAAAQH